MEAVTISTSPRRTLPVTFFFTGVLLSAIAGVLNLAVLPGWGAFAVLATCFITAWGLAISRKRGRIPGIIFPLVSAAVGLTCLILVYWIDSAWVFVPGVLLLGTSGFDFVKRGWEAPLGAQALWTRIKGISLTLSVMGVYLAFQAFRGPAPRQEYHVGSPPPLLPIATDSVPEDRYPSPIQYDRPAPPSKRLDATSRPELPGRPPYPGPGQPQSSFPSPLPYSRTEIESPQYGPPIPVVDTTVSAGPSDDGWTIMFQGVEANNSAEVLRICSSWVQHFEDQSAPDSLLAVTVERRDTVLFSGPGIEQARYRCDARELPDSLFAVKLLVRHSPPSMRDSTDWKR